MSMYPPLTTTEGDISRIRRHVHSGLIVLNFGMCGVIADVITHAKFFCQSVYGFGSSDPPKFYYLRSYNSVSTAVLHCDQQHNQWIEHIKQLVT